ncbi:DarT ssDNA thymidine ADP-ribosyltransferase family protein [uncultured Nostoc sp.]|uniref:DarT ssDNA thymidine ADP-ribosyltransferase family protein n=1 Tax=uncultured Nostoc sp. TaxID=340711 RepID=UPI0035CB8A55
MKRKKTIDSLYYITHINNVPSILKKGVLSHAIVEQENIQRTPVYDQQIVANRSNKNTPDGKSLWEYANLYFQPRNPMLYRVINENKDNGIVVLSIQPSILNRKDAFITTGNAASHLSQILPASSWKEKEIIAEIIKGIDIEWWKEEDGTKRKIMAECLVFKTVAPDCIQAIYVPTENTAKKLEEIIQNSEYKNLPRPPVSIEPTMFFLPYNRIALTNTVSIVEGDMFFSRMQTLTISVNCVGVMGKGLASTAKYRFPDMYVHYEDLCKNKILQMGKPKLHKRESSIFNQLAEETTSLPSENGETWFLLFPTKQHWKNNADIDGIEEGLKWVQDNYKKEGIKSLAMPALGCGLGNLEWSDVGPLMCKYLKNLDIHVSIYLPTDRKVAKEFLTKEFLLS